MAVTDIFQAMQMYLGGLYISDFNYLGRTWHVTAQADAPFRASADQVSRLKTRNAAGQMVPIGAVADLKDIVGPDRLQRYDLYASAEINGASAPGYSSGQGLAAMEQLATAEPADFGYERTDLAYQEKAAGNLAFLIFPLCVLLAHNAAVEASRSRLRPILMTSFAFIFGVIPLINATGAGAEMRQALGRSCSMG